MGSGADHASQNGNGRVAVLIPCYNEEVALGQVINDFKRELPGADIVVFDNDSSDRSIAIAREHGALVVSEPRRGKGFVVRRMFDEAPDADFFVMVDGDATYDAGQVQQMLEPLRSGEADLVVGSRVQRRSEGSFDPCICSEIGWSAPSSTASSTRASPIFSPDTAPSSGGSSAACLSPPRGSRPRQT